MKFLVFIISLIAGFQFFLQPLASLIYGVPVTNSILNVFSENTDTELYKELQKVKKYYVINILLGVAFTIFAIILMAGALSKYKIPIILGYFVVHIGVLVFFGGRFKSEAIEKTIEVVINSEEGKSIRRAFFASLDVLEKLLSIKTHFHAETYDPRFNELEEFFNSNAYLFTTEERISIGQRLIKAKAQIEDIRKEKINEENDYE